MRQFIAAFAASIMAYAQLPEIVPAPGGATGPEGGYPVGNGVSAPTLILQPKPHYPAQARKLLAQGTVRLGVVVQPDGTTQVLRVTRPVGFGMDESAIEAVKQWRYRPGLKDGIAVPVALSIPVSFVLSLKPGADFWISGPMVFAAEAGLTPPVVKDGAMPGPVREIQDQGVELEFMVDSSGSVRNIHPIHGSEAGSQLFARSLAAWKFQPAVKDNRSVEATGRVSFTFIKGQADQAAQRALPAPPTQSTPVAPGAPVTGAPSVGTSQMRTLVNPTDGQRYVWIPPGAVTIGCSPGDTECAPIETPPHAERIPKGFWLGQTEVTQAAYQRVTGGNPSAHKGDPLPVESLTWNHAVNYCTAIGGRLPTEVEWEYAARAGSQWARYGSLDEVAWHSGNAGGTIHPVAMKQPNAFVLYDMLGNVWEWMADSFPGSPDKILRGGAWTFDPTNARASSRLRSAPSGAGTGRGFRCAGDWPEAEKTAPAAPPVSAVPVRTVSPPAAAAHDPMVNQADGLTYVWIPPGAFTMGCSPGDTQCDGNEKPAHAEQIEEGFWLGQTEVTQAAYRRVTGKNPSVNQRDSLPVDSVTWSDASKYCVAIGGHLPSEIEWEYAARAQAGVTGARYGTLDAVAWHSGNSGGTTHPVATRQENAFGLYDMLGNVWEWVEYSEMESIVRGGSSVVDGGSVRASRRLVVEQSVARADIGFRCAGERPAPVKTLPAGNPGTLPPTAGPAGGPPNGVYRIGDGVSAPTLLRKVEPEYSEEARQNKLKGTVLLYIQIDPSGKAINIRVLRSLGMGLDEKAIQAVKKWQFKPAFKDGRPVTVESQVEVNFHLL